jgi:hypothetical protein
MRDAYSVLVERSGREEQIGREQGHPGIAKVPHLCES